MNSTRCPIVAINDALALLDTGRVQTARAALADLPELVMAAMGRAEERGRREGERKLGELDVDRAGKNALRARERIPQPTTEAPPLTHRDPLRAALADPATRQRASVLLRLDDSLLLRVAAGRLELAPGHRRLLRGMIGR
jgi:hypothetical protein